MSRILAGRRRQSGATAIEFALVFPILLAVLYSTIVYAYVYVLQQSINFAAQQGAQAAIAVVLPNTAGTTQYGAASAAAINTLTWLPTGQQSRVSVPAATPNCGSGATGGGFPVEVDFALGSPTPLFPSLMSLLVSGSGFPPLPNTLVACAVVFD